MGCCEIRVKESLNSQINCHNLHIINKLDTASTTPAHMQISMFSNHRFRIFSILIFLLLATSTNAQWEKLTSISLTSGLTIEKAGSYYFMGNENHLYRSNDTGLTWEKIENFPAPGYVQHLYYFDGTLYATMLQIQSSLEFYIYKTSDFGETWETLPVLNMEATFENFQELVAIGDTVFAAKGFLYKLVPGGDWEKIPHIAGGIVRDGNDIYTFYDRVRKSSDFGETFVESTTVPDNSNSQITSMAVKGDTIVANASFSRILSYDGGINWETTANTSLNWRNMIYDGGFFINMGDASVPIEFSVDGANWTPLQGLSYYSGRDLAISGDTLIIAETGAFRSDDFGEHWKFYSNGLENAFTIFDLELIGDHLSASGHYISKDDGMTWFGNPLTFQYPMKTAAQRGDSLLILSEYLGFLKADTSLEYMRLVSHDFIPYSFDDEEALVMKGDSLFISDENTLAVSSDEGVTWQVLENQPDDFKQLTLSDGDLYTFGYNSALWRSTDNGNTWTAPTSAGIDNLNSFNLKKLQAAQGNLLLVQKYSPSNLVMVSSDKGASFDTVNFVESLDIVEDMEVYEDEILVASSKGVFLSFDFGVISVNITGNLPFNYIKSIAANERYIFVSDTARNIWRRPWSSIEVVPTVDIKENESTLVMKPNPSSGKTLIFPINMRKENSLVKIYDSTGRLCKVMDYDAKNYYQEIDMEGAPVGLYYVMFTNGKQKATAKWIIGL